MIKNLSLALILSFSFISCFAQSSDRIKVVHKHEKYTIGKGCYDSIKWDEVIVNNKLVNNTINAVIRRAVMDCKIKGREAKIACDTSLHYYRSTEFTAVYAKNNIISYYLSTDTYYSDKPDNSDITRALNFNATTGEQVEFDDLFKPDKIKQVNGLLIRKIERSLPDDPEYIEDLRSKFKKNKIMRVDDLGIEILFVFDTRYRGMILTYKELKPFVKMNGFLQQIYAKIK